MTDKTFKSIMIVYSYNHKKYTYKFYNPGTKRTMITSYGKWVNWKMTDTAETLKMFRKAHKEDLVPGFSIREYISQSIFLFTLCFFCFGKESISSFLLLFSILQEQGYLLFFMLFAFGLQAQSTLYPSNHFINFRSS